MILSQPVIRALLVHLPRLTIALRLPFRKADHPKPVITTTHCFPQHTFLQMVPFATALSYSVRRLGVISDVSRSEEVHCQPVLPGRSPLPLPSSLHSAACFLSNNPESLLTILLPNRFCTVLLLIPTLSSGFVRVSFCT